jgi:uncharacterized membrane protein
VSRLRPNAASFRFMGVLALKTDLLMAFTDGVLAIAITIMVLNLRVPAAPG